MIRPSLPLLGLAVLALPVLAQPDGGEEQPSVQRNPQVGESRSDTSPPLRDIPPVPPLTLTLSPFFTGRGLG